MITPRPQRIDPATLPSDWHPLIKTIYAARLNSCDEIEKRLQFLLPPSAMAGLESAVKRIAVALKNREKILIYGDYDVDGATATALMVRVLKHLGAKVSWFIPQRQVHGYGFNPLGFAALSERYALIITVDNGIQSHAGVAVAKKAGTELIITDHHLPGKTLPDAVAVVDPNRHDCPFPGKNLSGVGVAFYVLLALRHYLLQHQQWPQDIQLTDYLDLVALGTVADVVPLDYNNRILVHHGLGKMRLPTANTGIRALMAVVNLDAKYLNTRDIAFSLAPRLNALGRLGHMSDGVALLLSEDRQTALEYARLCDEANRDRKMLEKEAVNCAIKMIAPDSPLAIAYNPDWHEGVIGLVATRLKSHFSRPAMVGTNSSQPHIIKASLRSIAGVSLHRLLADTARHFPADIVQFGGHETAAGVSIDKQYWTPFSQQLSKSFHALYGGKIPPEPIYIDGELPPDLFNTDWANYLEHLEPWGAALPAPVFANRFEVLQCRRLGQTHTKLLLRTDTGSHIVRASWFFCYADYLPGTYLHIVYQLQVNRFFGDERLDLIIQYAREI